MCCRGASAAGRGAADVAGSLAEMVVLLHSKGAPSAPERPRFGVLQEHQSRAWSGLELLQLGSQPERQRSCLQVARQHANAACCRRCGGAEQRGARSSPDPLGAPAKRRWSGSGSGDLQALQRVLGPCEHAHVGACWGWGGHCRSRGKAYHRVLSKRRALCVGRESATLALGMGC